MKKLILLTLILFSTLVQADLRRGDGADVPPGTTINFAGASCPTGFLKADGGAVSRTTYSKLFAAINTLYGIGNGNSTFNLPNLANGGAQLLGTATISGCASLWSINSSSLASFPAQANCTYSLTGLALAPSTNIPAIRFLTIPAGDLRIEFEGRFESGATSVVAMMRFSDGVNLSREISTIGSGAGGNILGNSISQSISYNTVQSNVTLELKTFYTGAAGAIGVYGTATYPGVIKVWHFPSQKACIKY